MGWLKGIGQVLKALMFFIGLYTERNKERAAQKKVVADEIVNAFKKTDPKVRASHLNVAIANIKRLSK